MAYIPRVGILIGHHAFDLSILCIRREVNHLFLLILTILFCPGVGILIIFFRKCQNPHPMPDPPPPPSGLTLIGALKKETSGLGGKGKLTDAIMDELQNYYGIAIWGNVRNLEGMEQAYSIMPRMSHANPTITVLLDVTLAGVGTSDSASSNHGPSHSLAVIAKVKPVNQRLQRPVLERLFFTT